MANVLYIEVHVHTRLVDTYSSETYFFFFFCVGDQLLYMKYLCTLDSDTLDSEGDVIEKNQSR